MVKSIEVLLRHRQHRRWLDRIDTTANRFCVVGRSIRKAPAMPSGVVDGIEPLSTRIGSVAQVRIEAIEAPGERVVNTKVSYET